jgi:hypothetical protein
LIKSKTIWFLDSSLFSRKNARKSTLRIGFILWRHCAIWKRLSNYSIIRIR